MTAILAPTAATIAAVTRQPEPPTGSQTILVVDDSPVDRRLAGAFVERGTGWRAAYAADGREALEVIARQPPALVLTDMQMPELNGLDLVDAVRQDYPRLPVILMTAHGSEDLAIEALRRGAASYVPKRQLAQELVGVIASVFASLDTDDRRRRLMACLTHSESQFALGNDPALVPILIKQLQEQLAGMDLCGDIARVRVGIALEEALLNAIYHGNLEVSSDLKRNGDGPFRALVEARRRQGPYRDRQVFVEARFSRSEAVYVIRDQGPGFDPSLLPDPSDPANLERPSGRGLLLIRTFMSEVRHNASGNEITLVRRRELARAGRG